MVPGPIILCRISVWQDTQDIDAGDEWRQEIGVAINKCATFIAIISKKFVKSIHCKNELNLAQSYRKAIFPVIFENDWKADDSEVSKAVEFVINGLNWTSFEEKDNYELSLKKVAAGIRKQRK